MAYGVNAEVRILGGNPSTDDISSADIDDWIDRADSLINTHTSKSDWSGSDVAYEAIQNASNLYASAMVLDHFADPEGKAKTLREEFWRLINALKVNSADSKNTESGYMVKTAGSET
tara:strand:+ start:29 stop:379 length:351 start_codon:yes stop_codon:yes gene_type:complete